MRIESRAPYHEIAVPATGQLPKFREFLAHNMNGYTEISGVHGFWRDPESGKEYNDDTMLFRFVVHERAAILEVVRKAAELFPQEQAFAVFSGGNLSVFRPGPDQTVLRQEKIKKARGIIEEGRALIKEGRTILVDVYRQEEEV